MRLVTVYDVGVKNGLKLVKSVFGKRLSEESILVSPFGITSKPVTTQREIGVVADTENNSDNIILGLIAKDIVKDLESGETAIYSVDIFGEPSAVIKLRRDGTIEMGGESITGKQKVGSVLSEEIAIGGDTDYMVRYSKLEEAFNQLKEDFNKLVIAFNTHTHATAATGPPVPPTSVPDSIPASNSSADITGSKIGNVKTNSTV
jgi:hypothetical protein